MSCRNCERGGHTDFCSPGCDTPKQKPAPARKLSRDEQDEADLAREADALRQSASTATTSVGGVFVTVQAILLCARGLLLVARRVARVEYAIACIVRPPT